MAKPPQSDDNGTDLGRLARILNEIDKEPEPPAHDSESVADQPEPRAPEVPGDDDGVAPKD
jgi:hypothetical protein